MSLTPAFVAASALGICSLSSGAQLPAAVCEKSHVQRSLCTQWPHTLGVFKHRFFEAPGRRPGVSFKSLLANFVTRHRGDLVPVTPEVNPALITVWAAGCRLAFSTFLLLTACLRSWNKLSASEEGWC